MKHPAFTVRSSVLVVAVALALPGVVARAQSIEQQGQAGQQARQGAVLAQQAQGRREHLTTVLLSKGSRLGDMQR